MNRDSMLNTLIFINMQELGDTLIFYSEGPGIAKVLTTLGAFYAENLYEALRKAVACKQEMFK